MGADETGYHGADPVTRVLLHERALRVQQLGCYVALGTVGQSFGYGGQVRAAA